MLLAKLELLRTSIDSLFPEAQIPRGVIAELESTIMHIIT